MSKVSNKITNVHGCPNVQGIMEKSKEVTEKNEEVKKALKASQDQKEWRKQVFLKCKDECLCKKKTCEAIDFKQCSTCHDILKWLVRMMMAVNQQ